MHVWMKLNYQINTILYNECSHGFIVLVVLLSLIDMLKVKKKRHG